MILHDWLVHLLCTFKNATLDRFNNSTTTEVLPGPGLRSWSCSVPAEEFLRAAEEHCPGWLRLNRRLPAIFHCKWQMGEDLLFWSSLKAMGVDDQWYINIYIYINDCCIMYYCYYLYYYFYYLSDSNLMLMDLLEESFNWILLQGAHLSLGWKANPVGSETYNEASIVVTGVAVVNRAKETKDIKTLRFWVLSYFGHLSLVEKLR